MSGYFGDSLVAVVVLTAVISCPICGIGRAERMPENACQHFYRCRGCGEALRPHDGDCCVFCSYGNTRCPPKQSDER